MLNIVMLAHRVSTVWAYGEAYKSLSEGVDPCHLELPDIYDENSEVVSEIMKVAIERYGNTEERYTRVRKL